MDDRRHIGTVLVATDFSEGSERAIEWATEVARAHGARIVLAHGLLPIGPMVAAPEAIPVPPEIYEEDRKRCAAELVKRAESLRAGGARVETHLGEGMPSRVIVDAADKLGADLVVAGTRGQTGWRRVFLGSTAAEIVRGARCPVLTVHPEHVRSNQPIQHILVPTDYSEDAMQALRAAVGILAPAAAGARVTLLHAFRLQAGAVYPWAASTLAYRANELARESVERLEQIAEPIRRLGFDVQTTAREGYPPQVIDEEASRLRVDLIAMGTHGRSGLKRLVLGSVAERILPNAPCPVVTVHTEEKR